MIQPRLPVPFGDVSPGRAQIEMEGRERKRRLRQIRDRVLDHQVAHEGEAVKHDGQHGQAQERRAGRGPVIARPARDQPEGQDDNDRAVGGNRGPLGADRQPEQDAGQDDGPPLPRRRVAVEVKMEDQIGQHDKRDRDDVDHRRP